MAAGLGFKTFTTGEVLTAADTNGYLMQGINVFASTAARDASITSPQEGQFAFTKDTNSLWYYDGAAWVASGATGDIEGVTAGVGITGGGTSGTVTVTNSMATAIDAKGDIIGGTGADAFSRLAVGANNTVLTADSAEATGLKWATPASGGWTLDSTTALSGASVSLTIPSGYKQIVIFFDNWQLTGNAYAGACKINNDSGSNYIYRMESSYATDTTATNAAAPATAIYVTQGGLVAGTTAGYFTQVTINNYASTTAYKLIQTNTIYNNTSGWYLQDVNATWRSTSAITSFQIAAAASTFSAGNAYVYGVK